MKRWVCWLLAASVGVAIGLVGCATPPRTANPAPVRVTGEPVAGPTTYFIVREDGTRVYFASEDDLKLAISRGGAAKN